LFHLDTLAFRRETLRSPGAGAFACERALACPLLYRLAANDATA
jgi:hypothetical protein